jgi:hypothetical protein
MPESTIIDTFPAFLDFWSAAQAQPLDAQIEAWASDYMSQWPELLGKQLDDYASEGEDWRQIARERVFPFLGDRLPAMQAAHGHLLQACAPTYSAAREALDFQQEVLFVIYVGIGCGAGWATDYAGTPAVLFGLENVAECGWTEPDTLSGLVAHEIGHLVHDHWRAGHARPEGSDPWWQLYSEGFAQRCEHVIQGRESWHMKGDGDAPATAGDWLTWCQEQERWLAAHFLETVEAGESVRPFFGSWYDIRGRSQCGYYLGHQLIKRLQAELSLKEIALLDPDDDRLRHTLEWIAAEE